ncbi:DUF4279 domain-containing protein [Paraburkholderia caballeronis]|uniref:DUF4279 domain-containing protein n=1 Tax=Paraburkholderia caballeronis TaxID=416943 RepID=A0A1H7S867_9BURK|nr:DUF4279 domain-containing protein [Paraburkholderia caballeronis]PXW22930.1 uncharacterized protein DUF4279 [Paraburkholderia caballeronis]PXW97315.1 uncharacterized protein DUF4279 [Paraburkholderia caballeronis]RAJ93835.1 uncharacterized protein DUF4279 [Paraburkholderia caballeronis]SED56153.1 protein of unknown function [Paraburkholderia caballeronis]SEL68509.1 protein of unknown function [Paraburkholderia caballeronis]
MESHERAYASFTVSGDQVSPEFWTGYFGVVPDIAHTKGDPVVDRNGQPRNIERRTGVWGVRSQSSVRSDHLTPHLQYLVYLPRADLPDLLNKQAARMRFFRYWDNETGDRVPDVPADIRAMMDSLGGTVEIDEYR